MFGRLLGGTLYIHFREFLPRNGILAGATFTLRPSLALSNFGSVTAIDVNKTFYKTKTKTSEIYQDQDQDQAFLVKTKTKTYQDLYTVSDNSAEDSYKPGIERVEACTR